MSDLEARWRDLGSFIREQRRLGHLSLRKLSEKAGISNPYLSQIERGLRKPSAEILQQIARALEISSETLYVQAGILEEREGSADLVTEIRRDPWLDEDQKKSLIQIYESFRSARSAVVASVAIDDPDPDRVGTESVASGAVSPSEPDESDGAESGALAGR